MRALQLKTAIQFLLALVAVVLSLNGAALTRQQAEAIVNDKNRTKDERLDERRKPVDLLLFSGVEPGMKVADIDAGRGWTTELMGRAVGPSGVIYTRTSANRADELKQTLAAAGINHAIPVALDMTSPLPPEVNDLDIVIVLFAYHHMITRPEETRKQAYANVMAALKPGGSFIVVDTQAKNGAGPETGNTIHRLAPDLMRKELESAGFEFVAEADFLQNPNDSMDIPGREVQGTPSAFVHRYKKPE